MAVYNIYRKAEFIPASVWLRNPSSTEKDLESSVWNLESTALNPESKNVLDSLTWVEKFKKTAWYRVI